MHRSGHFILVLLASLTFGALAGCDDECSTGKTECIGGALIRTCVPTADNPEWLVSQCPDNTACVDDATQASGAASNDGGMVDTQGVAACVGTCETGQSECVNDALARFCVNGGVWQLDACELGEQCVAGECVVSSGAGAVQRCMPDAMACASNHAEKVCDPDGTAWTERECAANEVCAEDHCVPDPRSSCDDENTCLDNKTAVRCLGQDLGFALVACPGDTYCENGNCRGVLCALGSMCIGGNQVRDCVDGDTIKDTQCAVNEVCFEQGDKATCVPRECNPGAVVCGDPRDPSVDATKFYTTCASANETMSNVPQWVVGECAGGATCDPAALGSDRPCRQECTAGEQRCAFDSILGTNDGTQTCGEDGHWLPVEKCNAGTAAMLECAIVPSLNASELPKTVCADPVCAWVFDNVAAGTTAGTCEAGQLRTCAADGTLGEAAACAVGVCQPLVDYALADQRIPGACSIEPECQEGEESCVTADGNVTSLYRTCVNGSWSTALVSCPSDGSCYPTTDANGLSKKVCGAECSPNQRRCNGSDELETCSAAGTWGAGAACTMGSCRDLSNNDAACVLDCVPGATVCTGSAAIAADGVHFGTTQSVLCSSKGTFGTATVCAAGTTCRTSGTSEVLGCIECVGPMAPGGNEAGVTDSMCDPSANTNIIECDTDNTFKASRACGGAKVCQGGSASSCGNCSGDVCTESNLNAFQLAQQTCESCDVQTSNGGVAITNCTQTAIAATLDVVTPTCAAQGEGTPTNWAGFADCCSARTNGPDVLGCAAFGEAPTAAGGYIDCCDNHASFDTNGSFAYCAEP